MKLVRGGVASLLGQSWKAITIRRGNVLKVDILYQGDTVFLSRCGTLSDLLKDVVGKESGHRLRQNGTVARQVGSPDCSRAKSERLNNAIDLWMTSSWLVESSDTGSEHAVPLWPVQSSVVVMVGGSVLLGTTGEAAAADDCARVRPSVKGTGGSCDTCFQQGIKSLQAFRKVQQKLAVVQQICKERTSLSDILGHGHSRQRGYIV